MKSLAVPSGRPIRENSAVTGAFPSGDLIGSLVHVRGVAKAISPLQDLRNQYCGLCPPGGANWLNDNEDLWKQAVLA